MLSLLWNSFDSGFDYVYVWLSLVGFLGFGWVSVFLSFLLGFSRANSTGVISVSINESTGEMLAWNTSTVSFDCPNFRSSVGSPLVFSDRIHVSSVSW